MLVSGGLLGSCVGLLLQQVVLLLKHLQLRLTLELVGLRLSLRRGKLLDLESLGGKLVIQKFVLGLKRLVVLLDLGKLVVVLLLDDALLTVVFLLHHLEVVVFLFHLGVDFGLACLLSEIVPVLQVLDFLV